WDEWQPYCYACSADRRNKLRTIKYRATCLTFRADAGSTVAAAGRPGRARATHSSSVMTPIRVLIADDQPDIIFIRGASPLALPYTHSRAPLRPRAPFAWLARFRSRARSDASGNPRGPAGAAGDGRRPEARANAAC